MKEKTDKTAARHTHPFPAPGSIRLQGEMGRRMELTVHRNLFALDLDNDFLRHFQERVPYPWETEKKKEFHKLGRKLFNGLGETLDAVVFFAAYMDNAEIAQLKDRLIREILATQDPDGYIGQFEKEPDNRQLPTDFAFEDGSFLALALANDALMFHSTKTLDAARRLIQCLHLANSSRPDMETRTFSGIGFCDAALTVYRITGDAQFLDIARHTRLGPLRTSNYQSLHDWTDDPPFQAGWHDFRQQKEAPKDEKPKAVIDDGTGDIGRSEKRLLWHVYRNMERLAIQLHLYQMDPDDRYLSMPRVIQRELFQTDTSGFAVTGGIGRHEGWSNDQHCGHGLGETCASAISLQYFQEWIRTDQDLAHGDVMERIIYNQLFAAQEPAGRKLRYFTPATGKRHYFDSDIFCCPGNYRRGISRLPQYTVFPFRNGIAVNQYTACTGEIQLTGDITVSLEITTRYPSDGAVDIIIRPSQPARFPVFLRVPRWCKDAAITINGDSTSPIIEREWHPKDTIRIHLPLHWRWIRASGLQNGRAVLMRGPQVFTLSRRANNLPEEMVLRDITIESDSIREPESDTSIRPDGISARVDAWSPGTAVTEPADLQLKLTEYTDPDGEEIFLLLNDMSTALNDELLV